eukprot:TRINITY_DN8735_c0_g1_i1.p1 TRINITY_DN8735_c0_g1~~TRINITY_DN8735_c0_g1_i1.p1  ORF type:complete len:410 (-),score=76.06 TRINITY_DN8735_c0_g1_i1:99-1328(-)
MFAASSSHPRRPELNTTNLHFLEVGRDRVTVKYTGNAHHNNDVGGIQCNISCDPDVMIPYFEITVVNSGIKGNMSIGITNDQYRGTSHPGSEVHTYGYVADEGKRSTNGRSEVYGPTWTTGDVVGCGLIYHKREIFFTKNGKNLGAAFHHLQNEIPYFFTIGLHSSGEVVHANFNGPFVFDVRALMDDEQHTMMSSAQQIPLHVSDVASLVRQYFVHHGYIGSLAAFDTVVGTAAGGTDAAASGDANIVHRRQISDLIRAGRIAEAVQALHQHFPSVLLNMHDPMAKFSLDVQQFIELVRADQLDDAMLFSQRELSHWSEMMEVDIPLLENAMALLAYQDPSASDVGYLMQQSQRDSVADIVNGRILASLGQPTYSALEKALRHLAATHEALRESCGQKGEHFHESILQ